MFSRLRLSSHRFETETVRCAIHLEDRICSICHKLEGENHFVLECVRDNELRHLLIPITIIENPTCLN